MNMKSSFLFLTIFEIGITGITVNHLSIAKRSHDLDYLKTNAHQLQVTRISNIKCTQKFKYILNSNGLLFISRTPDSNLYFTQILVYFKFQNFQSAMDHCLAHYTQDMCLANMLETDDIMADAW